MKQFKLRSQRKVISFMLLIALFFSNLTISPLSLSASAVDLISDVVTSGNIQMEFFVSTSGDDANPGTYEQPFASIERAREAVAGINENMTGDIYVFIMPGTYFVTETINFNILDSGTNGYEVYYKALGAPSSVRLVGGMKVNSNWELVDSCTDATVADSDMQQSLVGKIYKTNLQEQLDEIFGAGNWPATSGPLPLNEKGRFSVNTMTVNDERAVLARTLNSKKFKNMPATLFDNPLYTAGGGNVDMTYKPENATDLYLDQLVNAEQRQDLSAQIVCNDIGGKRAWDSDTLPITSVDISGRKLTFNPNDVGAFAPLYTIGGDSRYFLQGNLAYLDTPGEFYFNPKTYDLYYYPKDGEENLNEQEIIVPTTDKVIKVAGERTGVWDDTDITPVTNITFDGLKLSDTSFPDYYSSGYPWLPYGSGTISKYGFPEWAKESSNPIYCGGNERPQFQTGTLHLEYADHITITNCNVRNAGMNGIEIYLGVTNTVINNSLVEYCGNGGILIEGGFPAIDGNSDAVSYTNNNTVKNTVVHDVGQMVHQTFGIQVANATYNTVTNCEIYNSPRRGLLLTGSDIGTWNNKASGNRNWNPNNAYDVKRDEYAHGNKFSNIYLHDVQQDGGDDGGLFTVFVYYNTHNFFRPNNFDQIVIDEVGAQPNMGDIAPNNINLDMGWCGVEMSNIKTVNPQHYTIENSNLQNGQVQVDNCTFYFKNPQDGLDQFDDSKMDYANIGIQTWQYPDEYKHTVTATETKRPNETYFEEDFEVDLDWTKWSYSGSKPELTKIYMSEGPFNGKSALVIDNGSDAEKPVLHKSFEESLNKVVTVKIFDRQLSPGVTYGGEGRRFPDTGKTTVRVDDCLEDNIITLGIDPDFNKDYYVMNIGGVKAATSIRRVYGWHELEFDYSVPGTVTLSVDGVEVGTAERDSFNYIALGSQDDTGENYYDQLYIHDGVEVAPWQDVVHVEKQNVSDESDELLDNEEQNVSDGLLDNEEQNVSDGLLDNEEQSMLDELLNNDNQSEVIIDWRFEDETDKPFDKDDTYGTPFIQAVSGGGKYESGTPSGNTMIDYFNTTFSVVDNPVKDDVNPSDKVLARSAEGGCHGYAQQEPQWEDYIWEFDYLYKSSNGTAKDNSANFIIYCQNQNGELSTGAPYQPKGYWFSINEGTNSLELKRRNAQSGQEMVMLASVKIDVEEFAQEFMNEEKWHNIKMYAHNGSGSTNLYVSVDNGKYVLEYQDNTGAYTSGTIAYNSMGTDFYMDNINIVNIAESPLTGYDTNFNLGNAILDKEFSPYQYSYTATIADTKEDVTLMKPNGVGAQYIISLNDIDITDDFSDGIPTILPLEPGNNTLTIKEITAQQIQSTYMFSIYKSTSFVSVDIPDTISVMVGEMPQLPLTVETVVNDGSQDYEIITPVRWNMMDQSYYKTAGTFTVKGYLTELGNEEISITVQVEGINSVDPLDTISGKVLENPASLLPKTIGVNYEHSGQLLKDITFKAFDESVYASEGTIIAIGAVDGYPYDVIQIIELRASENHKITIYGGTADKISAMEGEVVTVTANNISGKTFEKWVSDDGIDFTNVNAETTTFIMPAKAVTITATYKNIPVDPTPTPPTPEVPKDDVTVVDGEAIILVEVEKEKTGVILPTDTIVEQLNKVDVSRVRVNVELSENGKELSNLILKKEVIDEAKKNNKSLVITVKDKEGKLLYSWSLSDKDMNNSKNKSADVDLALSMESALKSTTTKKIMLKDKENSQGIALHMEQNGVLPSQAKVKIYVGDQQGMKAGKKAYLYAVNTKTQKYETVPYGTTYKVDKDGYITLNVLQGGEYVILANRPSIKVTTTLMQQIKVTPKVEVNVKQTTTVKVSLPATMEKVAKLSDQASSSAIGKVVVSYKSSNNKVATVSKSGKVTANKAGTVTITTTIKLYTGATQVFKTKIVVK